jgi:hypothetical protein
MSAAQGGRGCIETRGSRRSRLSIGAVQPPLNSVIKRQHLALSTLLWESDRLRPTKRSRLRPNDHCHGHHEINEGDYQMLSPSVGRCRYKTGCKVVSEMRKHRDQ